MDPFDKDVACRCVEACAASYTGDEDAIKSALGLKSISTLAVGDQYAFVGRQDFGAPTLVCFRGTATLGGWVDDVEALLVERSDWRGRVHEGFAAAADDMISWLARRIGQPHDLPIRFTGHSLGGAMATLASAWFDAHGYTVLPVYTFGSPRVGDDEFASAYKPAQFRVVNDLDPIPHVPLPLHYCHVGTEWRLPGGGARASGGGWGRSWSTRGMGRSAWLSGAQGSLDQSVCQRARGRAPAAA